MPVSKYSWTHKQHQHKDSCFISRVTCKEEALLFSWVAFWDCFGLCLAILFSFLNLLIFPFLLLAGTRDCFQNSLMVTLVMTKAVMRWCVCGSSPQQTLTVRFVVTILPSDYMLCEAPVLSYHRTLQVFYSFLDVLRFPFSFKSLETAEQNALFKILFVWICTL